MTKVFSSTIPPELSESSLTQWYRLLPPEKRQAVSRLEPRDRIRSLASYGLLQTVLRRELDRPPDLSELSWSAAGKPYFPDYPGIQFSLSHSGDFVVCALSQGPVGVDVETGTLSSGEVPPLCREMGFSTIDSPADFLTVWVLWESYVKYRGTRPVVNGLRLCGDKNNPSLWAGNCALRAKWRLFSCKATYPAAVCYCSGEASTVEEVPLLQ